jgi:ribokinase
MTASPEPPRPARVAVVGSANADLIIAVARRPGAGETVLGGELVVTPGGKGANQAVAAARLGARVSFVGCVGDDEHGRLLRSSLRAAGVDDAGLRTASTPTGTAVVLVTPDGDNSIVVSPGANADLSHRDVEAAAGLLARAGVLMLQREVDPEVSAAAAVTFVGSGGRVVLTLAPSGPVPQRLLELADPVVVNEQEALDLIAGHRPGSAPALTHADGGEDRARAILALGARSVVVTLGSAGAVAADAQGVVRVGAPAVTVVDTTGAGDALTGALAWRLATGDDLADALRVAVRVAAVSVTRAGAQPSYPTAVDVGRSTG